MKYLICLLITGIFSLFSFHGISQFAHANNWYFGHGAMIQFSTGTAVSTGGSTMIAQEGSITHSDASGNLLFYSNGVSDGGDTCAVWNRNHRIMPHGLLTGLTGYASPMQSGIVVPKPGSATEYYLFSLDGYENYDTENYKGLTYSIIDMTLDGGLGDLSVWAVPVNVPADPYLCEQIAVTKHANGTDYWLVVHESAHANENSNEFFVYQISAAGISEPMSQHIGIDTDPGGIASTMQISAQGNKLAFNYEVFDFDNATGLLSNPFTVGSWTWGYREFSRSGRYLYVSKLGHGLQQYDLTLPSGSAPIYTYSDLFGQLQIAPDGKIYVVMENEIDDALGVINHPELPGAACDVVPAVIPLVHGSCDHGLPNFIDYLQGDPAAVLENDADALLAVYPNVTTDYFMLQYPGDAGAQVRMLDTGGKVVLDAGVAAGNPVDVRELAPGMYVLQIAIGQQVYVRRLVVE